MKSVTTNFYLANNAPSKTPIYAVNISFDDANTDTHWISSTVISAGSLPGGVSISNGALKSISGTSQKLDQRSGISTIGAISFSAVDKDLELSNLQREKLAAGDGLRGKRVQVFITYDNIDLITDASAITTQVIDDVTYKNGVYTFKCRDVQRYLKTKIFGVKKTGLSVSIGETNTTLNVYSTTGFEMVKHPASASGKIDAPGQKVGYLKLFKDSNFEIVRYTGKTATSFTGVTRGAFGTTPLAIDTSGATTVDDAPKVEEFIYLEGPAVRIMYEILTGYVWNEGGEQLPDHWTPAISSDYIRSADFTLIGFDHWNLTDNEEGPYCKIFGVEKIDAKKFIENEFLLRLGLYTPVYANGEIGLKRRSQIVSDAIPARILTDQQIVSYSDLKHDMQAVINQINIDWNYDLRKKDYTRRNLLIDSNSISTHGEAEPIELKLRTVYGDATTYETLRAQFDGLRDRFAGPPLELQLTLLPSQNDLEVGDIVQVELSQIRDYNNTTISLNRNFEITQTNIDWVTGNVRISLVGSSQTAGALAPESTGLALQNSWYSSVGTEINATNFPGNVSSAGGVTTITGNITLTGYSDLRDNQAVYYCAEDLTINAGVTVTVTDNVFLRVLGFVQINGTIDGKGNGHAGGVGTADAGNAVNRGTYGAFGPSQAQDGVKFKIGYLYHAFEDHYTRDDGRSYVGSTVNLSYIHPSGSSPPNTPGVLALATVAAGAGLVGVPDDLRPSSGCAGGPLVIDEQSLDPVSSGDPNDYSPAQIPAANVYYAGGDGGNGGASMFIVTREGGAFGASGKIDLSGEDGQVGSTGKDPWFDGWFRSGAGGGGVPGALYWILDGVTATAPDFTDDTVKCYAGASPVNVPDRAKVPINDTDVRRAFPGFTGGQWDDHVEADAWSSVATGLYGNTPLNTQRYVARVQFLTGYITPAPDITGDAERPASIALNEIANWPTSAAGNLSTIEVTVTAPSDTNYAYSVVDYRVVGSESWTLATLAQATPEALIVVASDGTEYEVRARSVSKSGVTAPDGISTTITVTDLTNPTNAEAELIAPFLAITNLRLQDGGGVIFGGRDAKFAWDNDNKDLLTFLEYKIEILDAGSDVVRTETVSDPFFVYTNEKNREDYYTENATAGIHRQFTIRVTAIGRIETTTGKHEGSPVTLAVSNTAPGAYSGLTVSAGFSQIVVEFDNPTDLDYKHTQIYVGTSTGFTPGPGNLKAVTTDNHVVIGGLSEDTEYFVVLEPWDEFGAGTLSSEYSVTTLEVTVSGLSNWAYETDPADAAFIAANVANDAITTTQIASLAAGKITAGTITASIGIGTNGLFEVTNGYKCRMGAHTIGAKTALFSYTTSGNAPLFGVYSDGSLEVEGAFRTGTSGNRIDVDDSSHAATFYGNRGDGTSQQVAKLAMSVTGDAVLAVGSSTLKRPGVSVAVTTGAANGISAISYGTPTAIVGTNLSSGYGGSYTSVSGFALYASGSGGIDARSSSTNAAVKATGTGVFGVDATSTNTYAVRGISTSSWGGFFEGSARGLQGQATAAGGYGVRGYSSSTTGKGGYFTSNWGCWGVGSGGSNPYGGYFTSPYIGSYHQGSSYAVKLSGGIAPITAMHDGLALKTESFTEGDLIEYGAVAHARRTIDVIHYVEACTTAQNINLAGVYLQRGALDDDRPVALEEISQATYDDLADDYDAVSFACIGEGLINVCDDGGDIAAGDYLESSATAGKARKQSDGIQRNYTVAKARESVDWSSEPGTEKSISCLYLFG